jgi:hypothetical protein
MTSTYKILGQLYYGPEINQEPEIPGSGYYTTTRTTGSLTKRFVALSGYDVRYYNVKPHEGMYSDDGINWTKIILPERSGWSGIAYGNGKFMAVAYNQYSQNSGAYSTDGINWTPFQINGVSTYWSDITYGNGKFVALKYGGDYDGVYGATSSDGITWQLFVLPDFPNGADWSGVKYLNNKFIAFAEGGYGTAHSSDGINWSFYAGSLPNFGWSDITYGNGKFLINSFYGFNVYSSTDAITWTVSSTLYPNGQAFTGLAYGNGLFVATKQDYGQGGQILTSTDGINWTLQQIDIELQYNMLGNIIYANNKFVTTLIGGAAYSTDGITWTKSNIDDYDLMVQYFYSIAYGEINTIQTEEIQISIGGQGIPGSYVEITEPQVLYTVPSGTQTIISSIFITNHDTVERTVDIAVVPAGTDLALANHIRWDYPVSASDFRVIDTKITLNEGDQIYVFPSTVNKVGFTALGVELS